MSTNKKKPGDHTLIITALISAVTAIITAVIYNPSWIEPFKSKPAPTPSPTATSSPQPTPVHTPLPLEDVFPQVGEGRDFVYSNFESQEALRKRFVIKEECRHSGQLGLKLTYGIAKEEYSGWGVSWRRTASGSFNASAFNHLRFRVKGLNGNEGFEVGLKDTRETEFKLESYKLIMNISNWPEVYIPLNRFTNVDLRSLENISFSFKRDHGRGTICIDDIAFIK